MSAVLMHAVVPCYTFGCGESWSKASANTLAVTPVPQLATSGASRSTPAETNAFRISSGLFSLHAEGT